MKRHPSFLILSLIFALFIGCQEGKKKEVTEAEIKSVDLENISLQNLQGEDINLADYKGKVVFLNFWSTWCKPCIKEMPSIDRAMNKLSDKGVVFLAASDESIEKIEKFQAKYDFSFEFIQLKDDFGSLEVYSLPTTIIYDRNGEIVINEAGAREWDADDMIEKLGSL